MLTQTWTKQKHKHHELQWQCEYHLKLHPETFLTTMILNKLIIMKCLNQHLQIDLDRLPPSTQWSKVILLTRSTKRCLTAFSDQPGLLVIIWIFFFPPENPVKSSEVKIGIRIPEILNTCHVIKEKKGDCYWQKEGLIQVIMKWNMNISIWSYTPETNVAPENRPLEKEIPIGNHHF